MNVFQQLHDIFFYPSREKYGVSYSVFDGEELLEPSLLSIRNQVDYINVVYQLEGWSGEKANTNLVDTLLNLQQKGLIDEIIEYVPTKERAGRQERRKRNIGMKAALKAGITFFMPMDVDEFYKENELEQAKQFMRRKKLSYAICPIKEYTTNPTEQLADSGGINFVMFFSKITVLSRLGKSRFCTAQIDPTRQLKFLLPKRIFTMPNVFMHHMSCVRNDIEKKIRNISEEQKRNKKDFYLDFSGKKIVQVPDEFNILPYLTPINTNK